MQSYTSGLSHEPVLGSVWKGNCSASKLSFKDLLKNVIFVRTRNLVQILPESAVIRTHDGCKSQVFP